MSIHFSFGEESTYFLGPKQYIFASKEADDFSNRTSSSVFTDMTLNSLMLTNSSFENLFYANTSLQAKSQGSPSFSIRGSGQAARVLFVLDEVPLNFADGFGGSSLFIPIELTKNIHVIEGPTSALYGPHAMAGAVHFKTEKHDRPVLRLGLGDSNSSLSSLTTANTTAILPYVFSDNHQLQTSVFLENDRGDFRQTNRGVAENRSDNSQSLSRFTIGSNHRFDSWKLKTFALYGGLNKVTPGPLNTPLVTSQRSDAFFASVHAEHKLAWRSSQTVLSYSNLRSQFLDFGDNVSHSEKLFASRTVLQKISNHLSSQTLLDVHFNKYKSTYTGPENFNRTEPEIAQTLIYEGIPNLTVEPSLRYLARYNTFLSQLHLPYHVRKSRMWLSFAEGFRPPSLTDLFAQTPYFIGNRDLDPERSLQGEAGLGWDHENISVTASVFQTRYSNLFKSFAISPGVLSKTNVGKAESIGVNTGLIFSPNTHWQWRLNNSLLSTRELPSQISLPFSPKSQTFLSSSYKNAKWVYTAQHTLWSSFLDTDFNSGNLVNLPSWEGTDFLINYKASKKISMGLGFFNIFDNPRQLSFDFPEPQRRIFLNLEIQL